MVSCRSHFWVTPMGRAWGASEWLPPELSGIVARNLWKMGVGKLWSVGGLWCRRANCVCVSLFYSASCVRRVVGVWELRPRQCWRWAVTMWFGLFFCFPSSGLVSGGLVGFSVVLMGFAAWEGIDVSVRFLHSCENWWGLFSDIIVVESMPGNLTTCLKVVMLCWYWLYLAVTWRNVTNKISCIGKWGLKMCWSRYSTKLWRLTLSHYHFIPNQPN